MKRRVSFIFAAAFLTGLVSVEAALFSGPMNEQKLRERISATEKTANGRIKAQQHADLATLLYREGRMKEAADEFELALTFDPTKLLQRHIYLYLGKSYESFQRLDKAIYAYEEALAFDPKNWRRHRDLGLLYEQVQLYRKAVQCYENALERNETRSSVFLALGRTWRKMGLYEYAENNLKRAKESGFRGPAVDEQLSLVYEGEGRFTEALALARSHLSATSQAPEWARVVYLAVLAHDMKAAEEALERLKNVHATPETLSFYKGLVAASKAKPEDVLDQHFASPELARSVGTIFPKNQ